LHQNVEIAGRVRKSLRHARRRLCPATSAVPMFRLNYPRAGRRRAFAVPVLGKTPVYFLLPLE
jgi:hypothetical protein